MTLSRSYFGSKFPSVNSVLKKKKRERIILGNSYLLDLNEFYILETGYSLIGRSSMNTSYVAKHRAF